VEPKYYQPKDVRTRHLAIMDLMLARPDMDQNQIAAELGYTPSRLSIIVNSQLFKLAFTEYRRKVENNLVDLITEATASAIKFNKEVIDNPDAPAVLRQTSARDILSQGHAKAPQSVDMHRRSIEAHIDVPLEALAGLKDVITEAKKPVDFSRRVYRPLISEDSQ